MQGGSSQPEEDEGLPKGLRQLKLPPDKQANLNKQALQSQLRNRTARIKLDRKSLNFTPMCEVTIREAVSAITRAQNQACKQRIVNVTCLSQQGLLYPERIQSSCPHSPGFTGMPINLGCYKDDKTLRVLSGYYHIFKGNNTPERCAYMCLQSGFPYAGTEYSLVSLKIYSMHIGVIFLKYIINCIILAWSVFAEWKNHYKRNGYQILAAI